MNKSNPKGQYYRTKMKFLSKNFQKISFLFALQVAVENLYKPLYKNMQKFAKKCSKLKENNSILKNKESSLQNKSNFWNKFRKKSLFWPKQFLKSPIGSKKVNNLGKCCKLTKELDKKKHVFKQKSKLLMIGSNASIVWGSLMCRLWKNIGLRVLIRRNKWRINRKWRFCRRSEKGSFFFFFFKDFFILFIYIYFFFF